MMNVANGSKAMQSMSGTMRLHGLMLATLMLATLMLAGCAGGDQFSDLRIFMKEVEGKPTETIAPLPVFESYTAFTYGATSQRSPFEPPALAPPRSSAQKKNTGVKPPLNHAKEYLEQFQLPSLVMVGTLQKNNSTFALIEDSQGGVHRVQVGDYLGDKWGQIESIKDTRIDITEIVRDGDHGWFRKPRTLELRAFSN